MCNWWLHRKSWDERGWGVMVQFVSVSSVVSCWAVDREGVILRVR